MKIRYLKLKNWLIAAMSGLLGLNLGCDKFFVEEYGCPEATYHLKGTVTNEDGQPIEGIGMGMAHIRSDEDSVPKANESESQQ